MIVLSFSKNPPRWMDLLGLAALAHAIDTCYWPNGDNATSDGLIPCYGSQYPSVCCYGGGVCLSNGLCLGIDIGYHYRGACTDQRWDTVNCPQTQCFDSVSDQHANLMPCPRDPDGKWTCGGNGWSSDICRGSETWAYEKSTATPGVVELPPNLNVARAVSWGSSSSSLSLSSSPSSTGAITSSMSSSTSSSSPTSTSLASPTSTQLPSSAQNVQCASSSVSSSRVVAVGAGVGFGVGLPLLAMLAGVSVLYLRERRAKSDPHQQMGHQQMQVGSPDQSLDPSEELRHTSIGAPPQEIGPPMRWVEMPGN